jgi:hypothetical protein
MKIIGGQYLYIKGKWETKDHRIINISDMTIEHLENTINFLKKRPDFYDIEYIENGVDVEECFYDKYYGQKEVAKKIEELELELRLKRLEASIKE